MTAVTCPFGLAITRELASRSIPAALNTNGVLSERTERRPILTYAFALGV